MRCLRPCEPTPIAPAAVAAVAAAVPAAPTETASEQLRVGVLESLHALYEAFKLDTLSWPLLPMLGELLSRLGTALGREAYCAHYARDLRAAGCARGAGGSLLGVTSEGGEAGGGARAGGRGCPPPSSSLHALQEYLLPPGRPERPAAAAAPIAAATPLHAALVELYTIASSAAPSPPPPPPPLAPPPPSARLDGGAIATALHCRAALRVAGLPDPPFFPHVVNKRMHF